MSRQLFGVGAPPVSKLTKYFAGFHARSADILAFGEAVDEGAD